VRELLDAHIGLLAPDNRVFVHLGASLLPNRNLRAKADLALLPA
jgi:hypothetical protein